MGALREWPPEGICRIPCWIYSDPEIYAREQERIFRGRSWSYVALEAEMPRPIRAFHERYRKVMDL